MSEENLQVEQDADAGQPSAEEIREAKSLGWSPKENWKGNPEEWVDAPEFLRRGREVLPILKHTNQRLKGELDATRGQVGTLAEQLRQTQAALRALEEAQEEVEERAVEDQLSDLEAQIEAASADGDHRKVARLTREIAKLEAKNLVKEQSGNRQDPNDNPGRSQMPPEVRSWFEEHDDYMNGRKGALLMEEIATLRREGDRSGGKAILDKARERVEEFLGEIPSTGASRVGSGNGGSGRMNGGGGGSGKSFADLPAEAKQTAERMAPRFVGPGKKYKDVQSWRNAYATKYFEQEGR